ncbi:MAG: YidC/Oxa1 family membrane protein insertase [Candidatus Saccharimonadales bacterium]
MFDTLIVQPVFNLLELIYAVVPGHDLGIAIILFTILIRLAMWPLVKKQLHHAKLMRKLQPELKKVKKAAAGDRQKEARLQMELYKEKGIKPFASIGTLIIQIPVFIALYQAVLKIINDPNNLISFSYESVRNLPWIQELANDIGKFDETLLGLIDLTRRGVDAGGAGIYLPAVILAIVSTIVQYYQTKLMMLNNQDSRKLSIILKEAAAGKETDQAEVTAAISRLMLYFLPFATLIFALVVPSALSLYLLTSSAVGYLQQHRVLKRDAEELHQIADEKTPAERKAELVASVEATAAKSKKKKKASSKSKSKSKASSKKRKRK